MKSRIFTRYLTILLLCGGLFWLYYSNNTKENQHTEKNDIFNRELSPIIYTRHARCRMGCRHIDASEVKEILQNGKINYNKSNLRSKPDPKYALEGVTHDNQQVRIIFAPTKRGMVVITCIDVKEDWDCNCN